jgi:serine/threonine-protein kinase SRPK3
MIEMLGPMPKNYAIAGQHFNKFFKRDPLSNKYVFKNISGLKYFPLSRLLMQKYRFKKQEAEMFADFLMLILKWHPADRPSAKQMLEHPWLSMPDDYQPKMSELEYQKY